MGIFAIKSTPHGDANMHCGAPNVVQELYLRIMILEFQSVMFNPNKIYTMKCLSMFNDYLSKLKLLLRVVPKVLKLSHTLSTSMY